MPSYAAPPWDTGYATPKYIVDEGFNSAPRGNALPRKTVLAGLGDMPPAATGYGLEVAREIMSRVMRLPATERKGAIKAILDIIDPKLWSRTAALGDKYMKQGMPAMQALEAAIAASAVRGIGEELVAAGKRQSIPRQGLLGLGVYGFESAGCCGGPESLGWTIGGALSKAGSAVVSAGKTTVSSVATVGKTVGGAASTAYSATKNAVVDAAKAVANTTCKALDNQLIKTGLVIGAGVAGGPAAVPLAQAGATFAQGKCGKGQVEVPVEAPPSGAASIFGGNTGLLVVGAGVALVLLLKK